MLGKIISLSSVGRLSTASSLIGSRRSPIASTVFLQVRHAGGKRRPSKSPVLNWKEKKALGLIAGEKRFKPKPFGYVEEDFEPFRTKNDVEYDLKDLTEEPHYEFDNNIRKTISVASLFGSNKGFGPVPTKPKKKNFSHSRIFGNKAKQSAQAIQ